MNKDKFNKLTILEQIDFINSQINNNSITSVCKEIGVGRCTIRDRFKKANYSYSKELNKYTYIEPKESLKELTEQDSRCTTPDTYNNSNTNLIEDSNVSNILKKSDEDFQNNIIDLVNNYDVLKEIIELHKRNTSVIKQQIIIDLDNSENKLTSLRINKTILDKFNEFCEKNKQFTKVDLASQALKDFIEFHS